MKLEEREAYKWAKYRWECMRRNPELLRLVSENLGKKIVATLFLQPKFEKNALRVVTRTERVDRDLLSPDCSFDEIVDKIRKNHPGIVGKVMACALINSDHAVKYDALSETKIKIEIDLDQVYSVDSLKRLVSEIIDRLYFDAKKLQKIKPKRRPNMTDFDVILKVGDMKREKRKNREIAKAIDPRKYDQNPESAIRLVSYYYKRYKELVDGQGFFDLNYP